MMISSAVIVPEAEELSPSSPLHKRRQSSPSYNDSFKRPRLDTQPSRESNGHSSPPSANSPPRRRPYIAGRGAAEERKRGQRLFGALLGTLSQSSTTTAQKRRADIEKKQLGKLQQRDEELEEEKRRKREQLDVIRRKEQKVWDEQSMRIRHRNMVAEAHFLRTKVEPNLFYKPWDLRPEEEDQIKQQIENAEQSIEAELKERHANDERNGAEDQKSKEVQPPEPPAAQVDRAEAMQQSEGREEETEGNAQPKEELVGADTTNQEQIVPEQNQTGHDTTNSEDKPETQATSQDLQRGKQEEKVHEDHGGEELVEGQEDDVIY